MINRLILGLFAILASCTFRGTPPGPVKFTVGNPYQVGGEWLYPRDFPAYDATGLATIYGHDAPGYTTDNEPYSSSALAAASPVLQLPCIVTVTNLVNGRTLDVRVNDRGPANPGRILEVTPQVASLLGFPAGGVVEVEVKLKTGQSAALSGSLGAGPKVEAAPVAGITAQSLAPPGAGGAGVTQAIGPAANDQGLASANVTLSGVVGSVAPSPGPLWVQVPGFGTEADAYRTMARIYGMPARVVPVFGGNRTLWAVNIGPYHAVEDADAALSQVLGLGIADPQIIVR
ncbi:SPOR domain-containing protein [Acidocella sp.]|uniref:SPOR domain-containing protein n=1 Tax=Acidocella sp. TaxID=50710 RepID=UPI00260E6371|nr:SPOR domain-containing protein [Acidocella sp.]